MVKLRLAFAGFRHHSLRTLLSAASIALEVAIILILVGVQHGFSSHPGFIRGLVTGVMLLLLWFALLVSFLCAAISRFAAISERNYEIGVLRALGASLSYVFSVAFMEIMLISIPGTILGIGMAYAAKAFIAYALSDFLIQETATDWWPLAGAISAATALLGSVLPLYKGIRQDLVQAVSFDD
jgi:ABC-type antimicrobial peptide transport system permease subunit